MFENLSDRLERSFKLLKGEGKITELNVAETLKDVRRALLDADVNYKVAKQFTDTVKTKAMGQNVLTALKPNQVMVKIVHDELATLMGASASELELKGQPAVILMAGLQGSGKTTFSGKLAGMLRSKKSKKPLLAACDVYRPAAIDQLHVLGEQLGVPVYSERENKNPVEIAVVDMGLTAAGEDERARQHNGTRIPQPRARWSIGHEYGGAQQADRTEYGEMLGGDGYPGACGGRNLRGGQGRGAHRRLLSTASPPGDGRRQGTESTPRRSGPPGLTAYGGTRTGVAL